MICGMLMQRDFRVLAPLFRVPDDGQAADGIRARLDGRGRQAR
jgi:hypothetical protein